MLSPGEWHKRVPKDPVENLKFRLFVLERALASEDLRAGLIEVCRRDILFYINTFVFTYDPRKKMKSIPFITYEYQDTAIHDVLECIETGRDLVIEKSRDMGASWICLAVMEWLWHFPHGNSFLMISRKEDLVDSQGDPDSLFWKVDFIHRYIPTWLRPQTDRRQLHFGNLEAESTIDGESTTAAAGVGGRRTAVFIDEFSRIEEGYQLLAGTADTTNCRIFNFTPYGTSNAAYKLARRGDIRKLRMHWSQHPEKAAGLYRYNERTHVVDLLDKTYHHADDFKFVMDGKLRSPWYDNECTRRANDREVAQMLDIDYQGSQYQFFEKSLIMDLQKTYCVAPYWEGDIHFEADTGRPIRLIKVEGGPLKLWCNLDNEGHPPVAPYAGGADLSFGTGATNSCLSFVDCRTGEKVLSFASPFLRPEQMAPRAVALCWLFKDEEGQGVLFAWECQGPGVTFGQKVMELGYRNVYYKTNEHSMAKKISDTPGWVPLVDAKRTEFSEYRAALASRQYINRDFEALEECLNFIHTAKGSIDHADIEGGDDPTGARVNHGDRVVPDVLAWKMCRIRGYGKAKKKKEAERSPVGSFQWRRDLRYNARQLQEAW